MSILRTVSRLSGLGLYAAMAATIAIMLLVTIDVILRNAWSSSIPGAGELSEYLQGGMVFLGIAATLRGGNHISADIIVARLGRRSQAWIDLATNLLSLGVFGLMTWALWSIATGPGAGYEVSTLLEIPTQPFRMLAAFGVGLMCLEIVGLIVNCLRVIAGDGKGA